jgi:hypothetical protein
LAQIIRHRVPRSRRGTPYQAKVVAAARAAVAGLVDKRADKVDTEPADGALFSGRIQIRRAESERIERRPIVDETYPEAARPPSERDGDISIGRMRSMTMRYGVGEELFENDQKPRPLVIRQTAFVRELVGKGLKPSELRMRRTERDLRSHRGWSLI